MRSGTPVAHPDFQARKTEAGRGFRSFFKGKMPQTFRYSAEFHFCLTIFELPGRIKPKFAIWIMPNSLISVICESLKSAVHQILTAFVRQIEATPDQNQRSREG